MDEIKDVLKEFQPHTETESAQCVKCGEAGTLQANYIFQGRQPFRTKPYCATCLAIVTAENEAKDKADKEKEREDFLRNQQARWSELCPPLYRETLIEKLPMPREIIEKVLGWKYQDRGLILYGNTGRGKTRLMWLLLRALYFDESSPNYEPYTQANKFEIFDASGFSRKIEMLFGTDPAKAAAWLEYAGEKRKVVFFDDFGKMKFTERTEAELFAVIESRIAHKLPTMFTMNAIGKELESRFSPDRGAPFIRRLREFCEAVQV